MTKEKTDQLNFYSTPISTIQRFRDFAHNFRKLRNLKATDSQVGTMVLEVGLEACEKELEKKENKND